MELRTLERALRGDLDWITMKALEKDRTRRYETPSALAFEIQRYLNSEPVHARAPSTTYRMSKFISRHRGPVAAAAAFCLLAVGFLVTYTTNISRERDRAESALERAEAEAEKAQAINEFLQQSLGSADPFEALGREVTVIEALGAALSRVGDSFASQPEIEAAVRNTIGSTFLSLGRFDDAEERLRLALQTRQLILEGGHLDVAESLNNLALVLHGKGDYDGAEPLYRESLAMRRKLLDDEHPDVAESLNNLGMLLKAKGATRRPSLWYANPWRCGANSWAMSIRTWAKV
jgi:tetratricopeptide (TPR) repeat protein